VILADIQRAALRVRRPSYFRIGPRAAVERPCREERLRGQEGWCNCVEDYAAETDRAAWELATPTSLPSRLRIPACNVRAGKSDPSRSCWFSSRPIPWFAKTQAKRAARAASPPPT